LFAIATTLSLACGDNGREGDDDAVEHDAALHDADPNAIDGPPPAIDGGVGVICGDTPCGDGQECCVDNDGQSCVEAETCAGIAFACDGREDCEADGDVCCFATGGPGGFMGSACEPGLDCETPTCVTVEDCPDPEMQECCQLEQARVCLRNCPAPP
jgi:hypothetical protein